jgi:D-alanine--D-alanine ligase
MRIAFTHTLRRGDDVEEGDFDPPETVERVCASLVRLGHEVDAIETSTPTAQLVARLEALAPDLVVNTATGRVGRGREAFFPDLLEHLGLPCAGSDAQTTAISRDKRLCKLVLADAGLPTPRCRYVNDVDAFRLGALRGPFLVKPNFEGSSIGIDATAWCGSPLELPALLRRQLDRWPAGVLVEEYVEGIDLVVPFLERLPGATDGIGGVGIYRYPVPAQGPGLYDYALKHTRAAEVELELPAALPASVTSEALALARRAAEALELRDFGRIDLRLTPDGRLFVISVTALPSLHLGGSLHRVASFGAADAHAGHARLMEFILASAARRHGLSTAPGASRPERLRVGLTFNLKRVVPRSADDDDTHAEFDAPTTIAAVRDALESYGHQVVELEATPELPAVLGASRVDVVFNIAEGMHGRNRESQVPALLELLSIPYSGSDPATLSITLDKALAKRIVRQAGVLTPAFAVLRTGHERLPLDLEFPAICKPVAEGSSKGVLKASVVRNEAELRALALELIGKYSQGALVETFLPGREFTVGVLGEDRPRVLPPMEIVFQKAGVEHPVYSFEHKLTTTDEVRYDAPALVDDALRLALEEAARGAFTALGCRDVARIDLRLDAHGRVNFIECNPLPGLTPDWSDLCMVARSAGMSYRDLVGEIIAPAIRRFHAQRATPGLRRG